MSLPSTFRSFGSRSRRVRANAHRGTLRHFEQLEERLCLDGTTLDFNALPLIENPPAIPTVDLSELPEFLRPGERDFPAPVVDEGDYYWHFDEKILLHRVATEYLVHLKADTDSIEVMERLAIAGGVLTNFTATVSSTSPGIILKLPVGLADVPSREMIDSAVRAVEGVAWIAPVFMGADSGSHIYFTDEVAVALAPGVDPEKFFATGYTSWERFFANQYIATVSEGGGMGALELANNLSGDSRVDWATPNFYSDFRVEANPNDSLFPSQWSLNNTGQTGAKVDADSDLPAAWDVTTGSQNIVVAVLDNGVQTNHPDLNIFVNTGEIAGNSIDDQGDCTLKDCGSKDLRVPRRIAIIVLAVETPRDSQLA